MPGYWCEWRTLQRLISFVSQTGVNDTDKTHSVTKVPDHFGVSGGLNTDVTNGRIAVSTPVEISPSLRL